MQIVYHISQLSKHEYIYKLTTTEIDHIIPNEVKMTTISGSVRLNSQFFNNKNLKVNKHQLSQTEKISYPTILRYLSGDEIQMFSGSVLYSILVHGMGLSPDEISELRVGDLFEFVEKPAQ